MAELLVVLIDANHSDTEKDVRGSYKRGDIVVVFPDGHIWGKNEGPPKFGIVQLTGITVEQAKIYLQSETEIIKDWKFPDGTVGSNTITKRRRLFQFDIKKLTKQQLEVLEAGFLNLSFSDQPDILKIKKPK